MPLLELSPSDQYLIASGDTPLLEVWEALPLGLFPPFPPVELPGGLNGLLQRGGFGQTFFFGAEVLGLTLKTPQGRTVQAGGQVVKNVQGYDLVRPFVGSFGALGEAVSVTLRLRPGRASVLFAKAARAHPRSAQRLATQLSPRKDATGSGRSTPFSLATRKHPFRLPLRSPQGGRALSPGFRRRGYG